MTHTVRVIRVRVIQHTVCCIRHTTQLQSSEITPVRLAFTVDFTAIFTHRNSWLFFYIFQLNWWVYLILILSLSQVGVLRTDRWTWWHLKCLSLTSESNPSNRVKSKGLIRYLEICMDYTVWHIHCITFDNCCPISR